MKVPSVKNIILIRKIGLLNCGQFSHCLTSDSDPTALYRREIKLLIISG